MFKRRDNAAANLGPLIGRPGRVQGDIEFTGGLHIDGSVTGNVRAVPDGNASLSVSERGVIDGSVEVPQVVLNGPVNGDIVAKDRVVLGAKARVRGNVSYGVIEMALGAEITGRLIPATPEAEASTPSAA